jgi:two-component system OmpR family response regulator
VPFTQPKPLQSPPEEVAGTSVLVVDDEVVWRTILRTDLELLGYRTLLAGDAEEALELARAHRPEVAIVDLMLPEPMDGRALVRLLRQRGLGFPVIFYTAYPVFSHADDTTGVVGYMSKSVDRADLYALIPPAVMEARGGT